MADALHQEAVKRGEKNAIELESLSQQVKPCSEFMARELKSSP